MSVAHLGEKVYFDIVNLNELEQCSQMFWTRDVQNRIMVHWNQEIFCENEDTLYLLNGK